MDFGGLVAGEPECCNECHEFEASLLGDDHVGSFLDLAGLGLLRGLDRLGATTGLTEGSTGSVAGSCGLVF